MKKTERKTKMKNIFKISKRGIIVILTLCIILGIAGTCLNVAAMAEETIVSTEEFAVSTKKVAMAIGETTTVAAEEIEVVSEEPTSELMPMMARECGVDDYGYAEWTSLEAAMNHYGTDFTYTTLKTPIIRNGNIYTHYYTFSDGRRMYFGVI